jgi:hypothetical protein
MAMISKNKIAVKSNSVNFYGNPIALEIGLEKQ